MADDWRSGLKPGTHFSLQYIDIESIDDVMICVILEARDDGSYLICDAFARVGLLDASEIRHPAPDYDEGGHRYETWRESQPTVTRIMQSYGIA